jgi:hypothetical protein
MRSEYEALIQAITETGVPEAEARAAATACAKAMARGAVTGYVGGGALSYFLAMNPATSLEYVVTGFAIGGGYALVKSDQCAAVRDAIAFWRHAPL